MVIETSVEVSSKQNQMGSGSGLFTLYLYMQMYTVFYGDPTTLTLPNFNQFISGENLKFKGAVCSDHDSLSVSFYNRSTRFYPIILKIVRMYNMPMIICT